MKLLRELNQFDETKFNDLKTDIKKKRGLRSTILLLTMKDRTKNGDKDDNRQPETGGSDSPDFDREPSDFDTKFAKQTI